MTEIIGTIHLPKDAHTEGHVLTIINSIIYGNYDDLEELSGVNRDGLGGVSHEYQDTSGRVFLRSWCITPQIRSILQNEGPCYDSFPVAILAVDAGRLSEEDYIEELKENVELAGNNSHHLSFAVKYNREPGYERGLGRLINFAGGVINVSTGPTFKTALKNTKAGTIQYLRDFPVG